jgi:hypothetical protein
MQSVGFFHVAGRAQTMRRLVKLQVRYDVAVKVKRGQD